MVYPINLEEAENEDDLEGKWWNYIRLRDFMFRRHIPEEDYTKFEVGQSDILIHREKLEGDMYPTTRYQIVDIDNEEASSYLLESDVIKRYIRKSLIRYIVKIKKIPYKWTIVKFFKNGNAKMKYEPIKNLSFTVTITPKKLGYSEQRFLKLETVEDNKLEETIKTEHTIDNIIHEPIIQGISDSTGGKVFIYDSEIVAVDKRVYSYKEHDTIFYFMRIDGGTVALSDAKSEEKFDYSEINVKCSEKAFHKYKLKVGVKITFKGSTTNKKDLGFYIHNVRKFTIGVK